MRPLPEKFEELEDLLLHHRGTLAQNTGVPFVRLVYRPDEEIECRRQRELLERTLRRGSGQAPLRTGSAGGNVDRGVMFHEPGAISDDETLRNMRLWGAISP